MLKPRVIIVLQLNDGVLFRTRRFVPDYRYTVNFVGAEQADEVVILDITRGPTPDTRERFFRAAQGYMEKCFAPVTVGGHVRTMEEIAYLLSIGADKVLVGAELWGKRIRREDGFGKRIADKYGRQLLVAALDYADIRPQTKMHEPVCYWAQTAQGRESLCMPPELAARKLEEACAGEILLTSMDRDGALEGYDLDTIKVVSEAVSIPVIANGGCGNASHMAAAIKAGASGAATANIFHISDTGLKAFKAGIAREGIEVRP